MTLTAAERAEAIRKATLIARGNFEKFTIQQELELFNVFSDVADDLVKQIEIYSKMGKIPPARITMIYDHVKKQMKVLNKR